MIYLHSTQHEVGVRIDEEADKAFLMRDGKETPAADGSPIVADANLENKLISEEEYNQL